MNAKEFSNALAQMPLIPILRGLTAEDCSDVAQTMLKAGMRVLEVPLNSPEPLSTINRLCTDFSDQLVIGAGTVLSEQDAEAVAKAGGKIALSPNMNKQVIKAALANGLVPIPGVATPTEAFEALDAGAEYLKIFPAVTVSTTFFKQIKAVLPMHAKMLAVGGVDTNNMMDFFDVGAAGIGIGSALYSPGKSRHDIETDAVEFVQRYSGMK